MARSIILSVAGVLTAAVLLIQPRSATAQQMPVMPLGTQMMQASESALISRLLPSVVSVNVAKDVKRPEVARNASGPGGDVRHSFGSGFVIDPTGVIATNAHVVEGAWQIDVTFADGTKVPAHLLNATRLIDVALIKIDVDHPLPALTWGDSDALQVGDPVFVIGNALGVGISVSGGIVSGLNRNIMDSPYDDYIQTDAAINHGNSGGPLFNNKGEVIGINTALLSATSSWSGLGFSIPARSAQVVIGRLMHYGWLRPGWVGIKIQQVTPEMALALGMNQAEGSIVAAVTPGGPAADAGLRLGDVIMHLGTTTPGDERALLRAIATSPIGDNISLSLWRDGKEQDLRVPVKEWPRSQWDLLDAPVSMPAPHHHVVPDLGIALAALNDANRPQFDTSLAQNNGVLVTGVASGSDAADHGLTAGDIIVRVQARSVLTPEQVAAALAATRAEKREFVLILVHPKSAEQTRGTEWMALRVSDD